MANVEELFSEFKSTLEKDAFLEKQHVTISNLIEQNKKLKEEVEHLKQLLTASVEIMPSQPVERIIVTPEEALLDRQIEMINIRGYDRELTLEDTKKLDLLIKNKRLAKEQSTTIQGETKKYPSNKQISNKELIQIALKKDGFDE